jgi:hypothetical protein
LNVEPIQPLGKRLPSGIVLANQNLPGRGFQMWARTAILCDIQVTPKRSTVLRHFSCERQGCIRGRRERKAEEEFRHGPSGRSGWVGALTQGFTLHPTDEDLSVGAPAWAFIVLSLPGEKKDPVAGCWLLWFPPRRKERQGWGTRRDEAAARRLYDIAGREVALVYRGLRREHTY